MSLSRIAFRQSGDTVPDETVTGGGGSDCSAQLINGVINRTASKILVMLRESGPAGRALITSGTPSGWNRTGAARAVAPAAPGAQGDPSDMGWCVPKDPGLCPDTTTGGCVS